MRETGSIRNVKSGVFQKVCSFALIYMLIVVNFIGLDINSEVVNTPISTRDGDKTLYVGGSGLGNYTKIQGAINDAIDGDTVFVYNGTYHENVIINKSISLVGENIDNTTINGSGTGDVVFVNEENVSIQNFQITCSGNYVYEGYSYKNHDSGIEIDSVKNCEIINNNISSNYGDGIFVNNSVNISIMYNFFSLNNRTSISIYKSSFISLERNNFSNNKEWIELRDSDENSICYNKGFMTVGLSFFLHKSNYNNIVGNKNPINTTDTGILSRTLIFIGFAFMFSTVIL